MTTKRDPLADAARREALYKTAEDFKVLRAECVHPHVHFEQGGSKIRCIDCRRYWLAGWVTPKGVESTITDFGYNNPEILDTTFRHSPFEAPRRTPLAKKIR